VAPPAGRHRHPVGPVLGFEGGWWAAWTKVFDLPMAGRADLLRVGL